MTATLTMWARSNGGHDVTRWLDAHATGIPTTLLQPRRIRTLCGGEFVTTGELPAGTTVTVSHYSNEGFNGITAAVECVATGERVHGVPLDALDHAALIVGHYVVADLAAQDAYQEAVRSGHPGRAAVLASATADARFALIAVQKAAGVSDAQVQAIIRALDK